MRRLGLRPGRRLATADQLRYLRELAAKASIEAPDVVSFQEAEEALVNGTNDTEWIAAMLVISHAINEAVS